MVANKDSIVFRLSFSHSSSHFSGEASYATESLVANEDLIVYRLSAKYLMSSLEGRLDLYRSALGRL